MLSPGTDWNSLLQSILFGFFAAFTFVVTSVIGPTYDNLFVPMMQSASLYPALSAGGGPNDYLAAAVGFSTYTVANVVDPLIALVGLGVALLLLARAVVGRWAERLDGLLPRFVASVIVANFTLPIVGGVLGVAGALYPVLAGWDGGAWTHWVNLAGPGQVQFSWDNGALAFVLSFVEFLVVVGLLLAVGVRDALLAVLVVLLPLFTLLWPLRPIAALARRAWLLFVEVAFLPCVIVVPLQLAVNSPSPVLLVAYLGVALAAPYFLSLAGTHLVAFGMPASGGALLTGSQRGLSAGTSSAASVATPGIHAAAAAGSGGDASGRAIAHAVKSVGSASFPAAAPLSVAELVGHTGAHLVRHLVRADAHHRWPPVPHRGAG